MSNTDSTHLHIRLPRDELKAFRQASRDMGMSLSMWIRQLARAKAGLSSAFTSESSDGR